MNIGLKTVSLVVAFNDGSGTAKYCSVLASKQSLHPPAGSPVDMLLASLAYCMVKSVEWAAKDQNSSWHPFAVKVTGTKAPNLLGRIEQMDAIFMSRLVDNSVVAVKIVKSANQSVL